ncbi:ATP-binding protein [Micromonospora sp. DT81.3]|uniref:ATP-binding protein n=1 Tax=Micromonospora sp. DT81.3 TaxID=3416523 RepID=UPI003CF948B3
MTVTWAQANQRYTSTAMRRVAALLSVDPGAAVVEADRELASIAEGAQRPTALAALAEAFRLSPFETDVLVVCAGVELDEHVRIALAAPQADDGGAQRRAAPTFGLALAKLPEPHWSALTPESPLRRWRLVEVEPGPVLTESPLHISERVLLYLAGVHYVDVSSGLHPTSSHDELAGSHTAVAKSIAACVAAASEAGPPLVQVLTRHRATGKAIAAAAAAELGLTPGLLRADDIPTAPTERQDLARRIEREAVLAGLLPVVEAIGADREGLAVAVRLVEEVAGPVLLIAREPLELGRDDVRMTVPPTTSEERLALWTAALGPMAAGLDGETRRAAELFDLDPSAIRATASEFAALADLAGDEDDPLAPASGFWELARGRARPRLEHLAERVMWSANWDQLVLPQQQKSTLYEIAAQARWRSTVHREWGFSAGGGPAQGISVLFYGPSGTGKSMAAGVITTELGLDLYRIDLSRVVSKYIGETEKNLGTVFDEAEGAGAVLLFDEADALFGRRSEVKDSHDRYANLEVSYLLQRMEAYDGLAILTTNQRSALDPAFLRRLRFAVQFPFPDTTGRADIWRRAFPARAPIGELDVDRLAQLHVAGGNIRTIALNAAFHAAADGSPIRMDHLLLAAKSEFAKLERPLPEAQVRGWI